MSDSADFRLMQNLIFNNGNGTSADAAAATLRIGSMVFSSWLRSLVSNKCIYVCKYRHSSIYAINVETHKKPAESKNCVIRG